MPRRSLLPAVLVAVVLASSTRAEWPLARGDANASAASSQALSDNPEVLWKHPLAESGWEATAVITAGKIYVGDVDGTFHCFDLATGEPVWQQKFPETGFLSGAALGAEHVYVNDFNGIVRCLEAASGETVWEYQAPSESYSAPNVHQDLVLVSTEAGHLVALDAKSGEERWKYEIEVPPLRCWPIVVEGRVLLAGCDAKLHAIDVETGEELDSIEIDGQTGCTPARLGKDVLFGTQQGVFYSVEINPLAIRWEFRDPDRSLPISASATANQQAVIFNNDGKQVYALKPASGEELWTFTVRSKVESSPAIAGKRVVVATSRGRLHLVDLATGKESWKYEAGGKFLASPALSGGRLVIGNNDGTLYCFGAPDAATEKPNSDE